MSEQESNDNFEELLRLIVIQNYIGNAAQEMYDRNSWSVVQKSLEMDKLRKKRKEIVQTVGLTAVTLLLSIFIFLMHV